MTDVVAIVLAAGLSRRMGNKNKLLEKVGDRVLLERVVSVYAKISDYPVVVVIGFENKRVQEALSGYNVSFVHNSNYKNGQMTSVDMGLRAAPKASTYLVALGDQPRISAHALSTLLDAHNLYSEGKITVPFVDGQRGNPIAISPALRDKILADPMNLGCRNITRSSPEIIHQFITNDKGFISDVDTPEELNAVQSEFECATPEINWS